MKRFFKIIILLLMGFSSQTFACDLNKIPLGKSYESVFEKYKVKDDLLSKKYSEVNTRGEYICKELKNAEVTLIFIDEKFGGIKINKFNRKEVIIYNLATEALGEQINKPNINNLVGSYAGYFDAEDVYATYKIMQEDGYNESLNIYSKKYISQIDKANKVKEVE